MPTPVCAVGKLLYLTVLNHIEKKKMDGSCCLYAKNGSFQPVARSSPGMYISAFVDIKEMLLS